MHGTRIPPVFRNNRHVLDSNPIAQPRIAISQSVTIVTKAHCLNAFESQLRDAR